MLSKIKSEFINRTKNKYNNLELKLNEINSNKIINSLTNNSKSKYENSKLDSMEDAENSKKLLIEYFINEFENINTIENNIPNYIKPLLSPYGTFYDGNGILYCETILSVIDTLFCILNHIIHYCTGMYFNKKSYQKQEIMRFFAMLDILNINSDWDFSIVYTKYFDKIFFNEFNNVIIFVPEKEYTNWMINIIEKNKFHGATYFIKDAFEYVCIMTREIGGNGITTYFRNYKFKDNKKRTIKNSYYDIATKTNIVNESLYHLIAEPIKSLLIRNDFTIIRK